LYAEDLKPGTNKDIGPKDIFELGSTYIAVKFLILPQNGETGCKSENRLKLILI
jgi:hypothetical protein